MTSSRFTVALAQFTVGPDRERNVCRGLDILSEAAGRGAQAICFAELSFLPFFPHVRADGAYFGWAEPICGPTVQRFREAAREHGILTIINIYERTERHDYFDTAVVLHPDGREPDSYRMGHLAESAAFNEKFYYWPGDSGYPVFDTCLGLIGVAVCHDRQFPEVFRSVALSGANVVFVPTAYSCAAFESSRRFFEIPNQAASMANGIFTVCVNRVGPGGCGNSLPGIPERRLTFCGASFITSPLGEVIGQAQENVDDLVLVELDLTLVRSARECRPFLRDRRPNTYGRLLQF